MRKVLFLHVPRTSGTALTRFFKDTIPDFFVQANDAGHLAAGDPLIGRVRDVADVRRLLDAHGGLALHVDSSCAARRDATDFRSLAWCLFDPAHAGFFRRHLVLTMIREPWAACRSTYAFVQQARRADPGFLPDVSAGSLEAYVEQAHPNAILHFLLEPQLSRRRTLGRDDLARVQAGIAACPIHVGIYERYDASIDYFARLLGRQFSARDLPVLNRSAGPPPAFEARLEAVFRERNALDGELYDFVAGRFEAQVGAVAG